MNKTWKRNISYRKRIVKARYHIRDRILIVCEGKKTEPNYFRNFPVNIDLVNLDVEGTGANTTSLVQYAIDLKKDAMDRGKTYNQTWCVFDRDSFPAGNFNNAFKLAKNNYIKIAYSNQCFELWYLLHYNFYDASIDRKAYARKLTILMGKKYKKNDKYMYYFLIEKQKIAISNAKKLRARYVICNPEKDDPCTTIYLLVEALNEYINS
ncbi:MAG: RloB family protein [Syntrophales bacterium]|jgi:hypothetical protein